jgi:transcriptional regulator with PAS, ATPase and Fis domain
MAELMRWEEFDKMHVIRRLKELVGNWWKIQINFTDQKGFLRGVPEGRFFNPLNSVCKAVTADQKGFASCVGTARQTTVEATNRDQANLSRCHAGFSTLSVPIRLNGQYVGCVFGDGFLVQETAAEQKALLRNYLQRSFPGNEAQLASHIDSLPVLSKKDIEYLTELINLVVDEIMMMHKTLNDEIQKVDALHKELGTRYGFDRMIGKSAPMQQLYRLLDRVCDSDTTVLIQGENGTGKELIAKALHYNSKRKDKKFLVVNCSAFNENLLESELFGHVKGSFTGAMKDKKGLFEVADGGTLFLDEIGDTSMSMQVKMLRVLQEGTFMPVGGTESRKSSVRILAATNRDLTAMVKQGTFREDLYYRLNVINVTVPPLRDRRDDIPVLTTHFLDKYAKSSNKPKKNMHKQCLERLMDYDWPGNVRELENEVERLCVLAGEDSELIADLLSPRIRESGEGKFPGLRVSGKLKDSLEELEKQMIQEGLERTGWNKSKLAKELGISRAGLIMKVEKYALEKRRTG